MVITLNSPASFSGSGNPIVIKDSKGQPFYVWKAGNFNLPVGSFTTNSNVQKLSTFVTSSPIPQDVPIEKNGMKHIDARSQEGVYLQFNPGNKASFYPDFNVAVYDEEITRHWFMPLPIFVMCHEDGHHYFKQPKECTLVLDNIFSDPDERAAAMKIYYQVEHNCDCYARNKMIRNGYNDIQVIQAIKLLLNPGNPRIKMLIDKIESV